LSNPGTSGIQKFTKRAAAQAYGLCQTRSGNFWDRMAFLEIDAMSLIFHPLSWMRFWFFMSRLKITLSWPPISESRGTIPADPSNLPLLFPERRSKNPGTYNGSHLSSNWLPNANDGLRRSCPLGSAL
jgi:hypothetical protein